MLIALKCEIFFANISKCKFIFVDIDPSYLRNQYKNFATVSKFPEPVRKTFYTVLFTNILRKLKFLSGGNQMISQ